MWWYFMSLFYMIISSTCFVVQPWLLYFIIEFVLHSIFLDIFVCLSIFVLSFTPYVPSSYILTSKVQGLLLLFISLTTWNWTCPSIITLVINSNISFIFRFSSFLHKLTNLVLVNRKDIDNGRKIVHAVDIFCVFIMLVW